MVSTFIGHLDLQFHTLLFFDQEVTDLYIFQYL